MYHDPMNVIVPAESEQYVRDQVAAGRFPSADEVVSEALRRMREHDQKLAELRREIAVGIEQADRGLAVEFNEATLQRVKTAARQRMPQS